jgi:hypothetical protein
MWVTDEGVWVFRERLVPDSFHALDPEERRARRLFDDYRHVLYLYSFSGELLRTVDHSRSTCGAPPAQGGSRRGLITKRPLGHIRCRGICRLLH